jgi:magnesium-transporting ATPase (P-type)
MDKEVQFENKYEGITDGEAWQRNYESGNNLLDTNGIRQLKNYRSLVGTNARVFRAGTLKKIDSAKLVTGDTIVVEKGDVIPADGVIIECKNLQLLPINESELLEGDLKEQQVYQGMKVLSGKAVILVSYTGKNTYIGQIATQIVSLGKDKNNFYLSMKRKIKSIGIIAVILFLTSLIVLTILNYDLVWQEKIINAFYPSLTVLAAFLPFEIIIGYLIIILGIKRRAGKIKVQMKDTYSLGDLDKLTILCIDDKFLKEKNVTDIQRAYKSGIRVIMFSDKNVDESKEIAKKAGLCPEDVTVVTAKDLENISYDKMRQTVLDVIVFAEMDSKSKLKVVQTLKSMGLSVLAIGDNIDDAITIRMADIGVSTDTKMNSLQNGMAKIIFKNDNFEFILEIMRLGRKFKDSLRKVINYTVASRLMALMIVLFSIIFHKPTSILTILILGIYLLLNPLFMLISGITNGDEDLLDRRDLKSLSDSKGRLSAIFQGLFFGVIVVGAYIGLEYVNIESDIIKNIIIGLLIVCDFILANLNNRRIESKQRNMRNESEEKKGVEIKKGRTNRVEDMKKQKL